MASRVITDRKAREKPCLRCGYSLRHLADARHCPECGLSVWLSLNDDDALDRSNPQWLMRMSLGALILALAQMLGLILWIVFWFSDTVDDLAMRMRFSPLRIALMAVSCYLIVAHIGM